MSTVCASHPTNIVICAIEVLVYSIILHASRCTNPMDRVTCGMKIVYSLCDHYINVTDIIMDGMWGSVCIDSIHYK